MAKKLSYYRTKADKLFQKYMKMKNYYCELCGKPITTHHHFHPKASSAALRYCEDNMIPVDSCHRIFHSSGAPAAISQVIANRGIGWSNKLLRLKKLKVKPTIGYYKAIIKMFENQL